LLLLKNVLSKGFKGISLNMNKLLLSFTVLLTVISYTDSFAESNKDTVKWLKGDFPPVYIIEGKNKNTGMGDIMIEIFIKNLPEYNHEVIITNASRAIDLIKNKEKACYPNFFKTEERKKHFVFSKPVAITCSNYIITDKKHPLLNQSPADFKKILSNNNLKGYFVTDRSYGKKTDKMLKEKRNDKNIFFRSGDSSLEGILRMIENNRADYTLGYPFELKYLQSQLNFKKNFKLININRNDDIVWSKSYTACPDNEWGRTFIKKLNNIIDKVKYEKDYINCQTRWLPQNMKKDALKAYKEKIISAGKKPAQ
jgi:uncharacterized protein (TIGR02285 family)